MKFTGNNYVGKYKRLNFSFSILNNFKGIWWLKANIIKNYHAIVGPHTYA